MSALLWEQARLRVRGFDFERRAASELPAELLDQIDTCFAVVNGLSTQETLLSALFHFRNLRLSLQAGEPYRAEFGLNSVMNSRSLANCSRAKRPAISCA